MPDPDFELFIIQYSILISMFVIIMTHHHITMLYCDLNVSFHQCIKSHHNIQVANLIFKCHILTLKCHSDVKMIYHEIVMHFVII